MDCLLKCLVTQFEADNNQQARGIVVFQRDLPLVRLRSLYLTLAFRLEGLVGQTNHPARGMLIIICKSLSKAIVFPLSSCEEYIECFVFFVALFVSFL
jgi:hypothetical protein